MKSPFRNRLLILIILGILIRALVAGTTELGNDEVYYWTYSKYLQWNYFDHPPMVAIWARLFTFNLKLQQFELFIRLGSILCAAINTWLIFIICNSLYGEKVGWIGALLYNASLYASIIAGIFIMPDSPQMLFWCLSLLFIIKISEDPASWKYWILFGICVGLCIMSKVHGIFLWTGLIIFIISKKKAWLRSPRLYISLALTLVISSPIFVWNLMNHFATYRYHGGRVISNNFSLNTSGFIRELFGEIFYNNAVYWILVVSYLIALTKKRAAMDEVEQIFFFMSVPMILIVISISLFRDTLPHWSGPAYVTLIPLVSGYIAGWRNKILLKWSLRMATGLIVIVLAGGWMIIHYFPGTLGSRDFLRFGDGDVSLDMYGWKKAGAQFDVLYQRDLREKKSPPNAAMICYKWFPAAHEEYYFCRKSSLVMIGLGNSADLHEYVWYDSLRMKQSNLSMAYCVVPSNEYYVVQNTYQKYFYEVDSVGTIESTRDGRLARKFYVYRLSGWKGY